MQGHRVIGLIAADRLTLAARAEVSDLLESDAGRSMEDVSSWGLWVHFTQPPQDFDFRLLRFQSQPQLALERYPNGLNRLGDSRIG